MVSKAFLCFVLLTQILKIVVAHSFNQTLGIYLQADSKPTINQVVQIMSQSQLNLSPQTMLRRGQTVLAWIDWIIGLTPIQESMATLW